MIDLDTSSHLQHGAMDRFDLRDEKTAKFWEIKREGLRVSVRYGAIDGTPRTSEREFTSEDEAEQHRCKQIQAKLKKGYVRRTTIAAADTPKSAGGLGQRFAAMVAELRDHPDIRVKTLELRDPKPAAEVEALLAASPFAARTKAELGALYRAVGGLELAWELLRADPSLELDPTMVTGEVIVVGLDEVIDNAEYIGDMGDMGSPEADARLARLHPISRDEGGYATAIDLDADDGASLALVADDGTHRPLPFGVGEWTERLLLCRGFHSFASVSEGIHSGASILRAVLGGVFGEADVGRHLPALADPQTGHSAAPSLALEAQRVFAEHRVPARVVKALRTDPCEAYAIFGDDFRDIPGLNRALAALFPSPPKIDAIGLMIGQFSLVSQSSWDLGHHSRPAAFWSLIDEQLQGITGAEEVRQRYAWIVDRTRDRFGGVRQPELTRELATTMGDLATALNPDADPELRELAWLSVTEWKSAPELIAEATRSLKQGADRVVQAIEAQALALGE